MWALTDHLHDWLLRARLDDPKHPTLWPSEASAVITNKWGEEEVVGKCRRATWLRYLGHVVAFFPKFSHLKTLVDEVKETEVPPDRYMQWIWAQGQLFEDYIINGSKGSGVFVEEQVVIFVPDCNLSGKIDLVVHNPKTGKLIAIEVKSVYGYGGTAVLGTDTDRKYGRMGTPRDSNLMQIALYDWWKAANDSRFEHSHLLYGARDTGKDSQYRIRTQPDEDNIIHIYYKGIAPNETSEVRSPITINSILIDGYKYVQDHIQSGEMPPRDFTKCYSEQTIRKMWWRGQLGKSDREKMEKRELRAIENVRRRRTGKKELKNLKPLEKGDWQCKYCKYQNFCFDKKGAPREV